MSRAKLLIIDPQNDFCDIEGAALPVAGASADLARVATLIHEAGSLISGITVTLDSHPNVAIERPTFWHDAEGRAPAPFTEITEEDVQAGRYQPRNPYLTHRVLRYLHELERAGRYKLMVWPVHCVLGTWGHNILPDLADAIAGWEELTQRQVAKFLKGQNPLTEQYSAVKAEVVDPEDPRTRASSEFLSLVWPEGETLLVAGEASSHCVRATMEDLYERFPNDALENIVLLRDCMSPVTGFEAAEETFLAKSELHGVRVMTAAEALERLRAEDEQD